MRFYSWLGLALALVACGPAWGQNGHFAYEGPLTQFMPEGATPAPVTTGLPIVIVLTEKGATIAPSTFEIQGKGWKQAAHLSLDGAKFAGGHLTGTVKLKNDSGSALEGVRLDITGATEEYTAKDAGGKDVTKTREQKAALASPLFFGDLANGEESDGLSLDVSGIAFQPETTKVSVNAMLSGITYLDFFTVGDLTNYEIDTDAKGRVYAAGGDRIARTDADGKNLEVVVKGDPDCHGVAIDPKTGNILVNGGNDHIITYTPGGDELSRITVDKNHINFPTLGVRVDRKGRIYNGGDNNRNVQCIDNGKQVWTIETGDAVLFDVDVEQNVYVCNAGNVTKYDANGKQIKRIAIGPDYHIGRLLGPVSCRVDPAGNLYVVEEGKGADENGNGEEAPRISVFDKSGHVLRVWGRGSKTQPASSDTVLPGELYRPTDLAFGPDGRIYILGQNRNDNGAWVQVFQPF